MKRRRRGGRRSRRCRGSVRSLAAEGGGSPRTGKPGFPVFSAPPPSAGAEPSRRLRHARPRGPPPGVGRQRISRGVATGIRPVAPSTRRGADGGGRRPSPADGTRSNLDQRDRNRANEPCAVSPRPRLRKGTERLILRHAWLSLWGKRATAGRINRVPVSGSEDPPERGGPRPAPIPSPPPSRGGGEASTAGTAPRSPPLRVPPTGRGGGRNPPPPRPRVPRSTPRVRSGTAGPLSSVPPSPSLSTPTEGRENRCFPSSRGSTPVGGRENHRFPSSRGPVDVGSDRPPRGPPRGEGAPAVASDPRAVAPPSSGGVGAGSPASCVRLVRSTSPRPLSRACLKPAPVLTR